jgi:hypothetical protein
MELWPLFLLVAVTAAAELVVLLSYASYSEPKEEGLFTLPLSLYAAPLPPTPELE